MAVVVVQGKVWHLWLMVKLSYQSLSCQDIVTALKIFWATEVLTNDLFLVHP